MKLTILALLIGCPTLIHLSLDKSGVEAKKVNTEKSIVPFASALQDSAKNVHWQMFNRSNKVEIDLTKKTTFEHSVFLDQFMICYALAELLASDSLSQEGKQKAITNEFDQFHTPQGNNEFERKSFHESEKKMATSIAEEILLKDIYFKFSTQHTLGEYDFEKGIFPSYGVLNNYRRPSGNTAVSRGVLLSFGARSGLYTRGAIFRGLIMDLADAKRFRVNNPKTKGNRFSIVWTGKAQPNSQLLQLSTWDFDYESSDIDLSGLNGDVLFESGYALHLSYANANPSERLSFETTSRDGN